MDKGTCKGCGAEIGWIMMVSGKRMPVNLERKTVVVRHAQGGTVVVGYEPHWATCPAASQFREVVGEPTGEE